MNREQIRKDILKMISDGGIDNDPITKLQEKILLLIGT
jgi:hypothetical protein